MFVFLTHTHNGNHDKHHSSVFPGISQAKEAQCYQLLL